METCQGSRVAKKCYAHFILLTYPPSSDRPDPPADYTRTSGFRAKPLATSVISLSAHVPSKMPKLGGSLQQQ
jgi:hypothetical protein